MGVRKLNSFLMNKGLVRQYSSLSEYVTYIKNNPDRNNCRNGSVIIAIDFWLFTHKFLHSSKSSNIVLAFMNQIIRIMSAGAIPIYVADGNIPAEKEDEILHRQLKRSRMKNELNELNGIIEQNNSEEGVSNTVLERKERLDRQLRRASKIEMRDIMELFDNFDIQIVHANYEADALCTRLYRDGLITTCLSDDMDMLALGCGSNIRISKGEIFEYDLKYILDELKLSHEQLIDICILFGSGYLKHPIRLDPQRAYEMIKSCGSLLDALFSNEYSDFSVESPNTRVIGENYHDVKDIYLESPNHENHDIQIDKPIIDLDHCLKYLDCAKWYHSSAKNMRHIKFDILRVQNSI